jgi:hypothetical protein
MQMRDCVRLETKNQANQKMVLQTKYKNWETKLKQASEKTKLKSTTTELKKLEQKMKSGKW